VEAGRIGAIRLFAGLPPSELAALAACACEVEIEAGHEVTRKGDFGHAVYAIESGTAEVTADGTVIRTVGAGDVVGEVAVLASGRRTASVVATSPMRVLQLFKRDVWALERSAPEAAARLRAVLAEHRDAQHRDAERRDAEHRDAEHQDAEHRDAGHRDGAPS
jgi:CRP-like cAMP-binding protein